MDQVKYAKQLKAQWKADQLVIISQGRWPPPWKNEDFSIQNDEGRLLSAIADNAGLPWHSKVPSICRNVTNAIGMEEVGNAKATVRRCIDQGFVRARHDKQYGIIMLDLTDLGAEMLDMWECEKSEFDYG